LSGAVEAQVTTYVYTGQPMMVTAAGPGMSSGQPNEITATVTLAAPLADNAANQVVVPISYGFNGIALPNPAFWTTSAPPVFSFTTVNGAIVAWNVSIDLGSALSFPISFEITSTGAGDTYNYVEIVDNDECNPFVQAPYCWQYDAAAYQRDVWVQQGQTPPITLTAALAEITTLQGQLTTAQQQVNSLSAGYTAANGIISELNPALVAAKNGEVSLANGYLAANATIAELNAALVAEKQAVYSLNAQVATCRAHKGVC
jgi:hypothetical protein